MRAALTSRKSAFAPDAAAGLRTLIQTDLYAFIRQILNRDRAPERNITDAFHGPLCDHLMTTRFRRNLYLLARGHIKTGIISVARNVQRILNNQDIRILLASNKAENAQDMLREIKAALTHPILLELFPDILWPDPARQAEKWTTESIVVRRKRRGAKEGTVDTSGIAGELTSMHYDHLTFDDIVGKENSQTREARQGVIQFYRIAQSLADPGATQDCVGTPWDFDDCWAWIREQAKQGIPWGLYIQPCWQDAEPGAPEACDVPGFGWKRPVFPERFFLSADLTEERAGKENLLLIRKTKGPSEFAAQYLLDPMSRDTVYFARERLVPNIRPRAELPPADQLWTVMTVDPALSTKGWADYSAIAVVGFDRGGLMHLLDLRRGRWPESELISQLYDAWARFPQITTIGFEAIAWQKMFRLLMVSEGEKRGQFLPVVKLERDTRKTKNDRIRGLEPYWAAGEIICARECPALEDFLDEAERWRPDKENTHDDLLDAVVDSLQLRMLPDQGQANLEPLFDDPALQERAEWEQDVQDDRKAQGMPPLDKASLRMGYQQHKLGEQWERERELATSGKGVYGEWL